MNDLFNRISDRDLRTTIAYLVLMICLSTIAFFFLFEIDGVKFRDFQSKYFSNSWYIASFWLGIICIFAMFLITYSFGRKLFIGVSPRDEEILKNAIERLGLPAVISKRTNLTVIIRSNKAVDFYDQEIEGMNFTELDNIIKQDLINGEEWIREHKQRIHVAENLLLDSSSTATMKFKHKRLNSYEWRLTSCPIVIRGRKHYFTIYSPAFEDDIEHKNDEIQPR